MPKRRQVWFGNFEFGDFLKGKDEYQCTIIHEIKAKLLLEEGEEENFLSEYEAYLVPSEFQGEVYFSKQFIKEVIK
jgi:hypothetical protein